MVNMHKLKVIVAEDDVDSVVRTLGEAGIVHFVDMREKSEQWKETLTQNVVSSKAMAKCSDILSKIEDLSKSLDLVTQSYKRKFAERVPTAKGSVEEILVEVEQKLAEMPYASIEALARCTALISVASQLIETFEVKAEDIEIKDITTRKPAEVLNDVEQELAEIRKTVETFGLTDFHVLDFRLESSSFFERIKILTERKKIVLAPALTEHKKRHAENEKVLGKKLLKLKKLAEIARESIEVEMKPEKIRKDLAVLQATVDREAQIAKVQEIFLRSAKAIYFEAWVPEDHLKQAIEIVKKTTDGNSIVMDEPSSKDEKVPTVLKPVPSYITAFEKLVYAFGYPSSGDVNPVRILAVTFPILFGIMFADVGQGVIFAIAGVLLTLFKRKVILEKTGDIIRYLLISSEMFIFLGISAIFFGFVFGEFFGPSGVIHPISLGKIGPFYIGGFEPMHEPMKMLKFAILVGSVHLGLGLILRFRNEIRRRHYKLAIVPICWIWLLFGGLFMWAYWGGISNISMWFAEGVFMLFGLIILPIMLILVSTGLAEGFTEGIGFSVEVFAETLSHAMSYSRLMALGLVHSAMNYLFLVLGGVEHGYFPIGGIPIIAIGTLLVLIIEGLVVFVHTLRLHWVEWFSKFHTGEGIAFKPFKFTYR